jgi:hypothetical protein
MADSITVFAELKAGNRANPGGGGTKPKHHQRLHLKAALLWSMFPEAFASNLGYPFSRTYVRCFRETFERGNKFTISFERLYHRHSYVCYPFYNSAHPQMQRGDHCEKHLYPILRVEDGTFNTSLCALPRFITSPIWGITNFSVPDCE